MSAKRLPLSLFRRASSKMLEPREAPVKFEYAGEATELRREVARDPRADFVADGAKRADMASSLSSSSSSSSSLIGSMAGNGSAKPSGTAGRTYRSKGEATSSWIRLPVEDRLVPHVASSEGSAASGPVLSPGGELGVAGKSGCLTLIGRLGDFAGVPGCTFRVTSPRGFRPEDLPAGDFCRDGDLPTESGDLCAAGDITGA
jgi:hypothetical protein